MSTLQGANFLRFCGTRKSRFGDQCKNLRWSV